MDLEQRRGAGVYTIRVYRLRCIGSFEPTISGFYDIGSFGMGIGGVLDRPTDTLPHGVYGVDYVCGPIILHVQARAALRSTSKRSLMSIFQDNVDITSARVLSELDESVPEALRMDLRRIVLLVSHLWSRYTRFESCATGLLIMRQCPNGAVQQAWVLTRSRYDNEDDEKVHTKR